MARTVMPNQTLTYKRSQTLILTGKKSNPELSTKYVKFTSIKIHKILKLKGMRN